MTWSPHKPLHIHRMMAVGCWRLGVDTISIAASLLKTAGLNFRIVEQKAGYLNAAVWRFRIALALLLALAILFVTYAATSPEEPSARAKVTANDYEEGWLSQHLR